MRAVKRFYSQYWKREKELEKKKSVLTTMYDELQRLRDDIELTEKLLRALEKEYYETRNEMSTVLQSVISENFEKFALEEQPILYNQVMQIQDAKQAALMLKSLRRQQAAMQYLASVTYSKFVQFNHGFLSDDDSSKSGRPPNAEEKKAVPPNRRRKSAIPRPTVLTSVLRHNNPNEETGLDDDSRLIFDRNVEVLEQQESSDYDMDLC
ncbi:Hypothetical predicted protein [Octopus vulgaris]|uniref:Uncharacterized protein n=1 Tax=Octopus vulgaris TaxID=6645 RepID=A0AA36BN49_OCTVU|nr:Hypothetical predicted protein [Octopus vulgaris]